MSNQAHEGPDEGNKTREAVKNAERTRCAEIVISALQVTYKRGLMEAHVWLESVLRSIREEPT